MRVFCFHNQWNKKKKIAECKEYSKYVYVEEVGVAMLPVKSKANVVAHCGVLETVLIIGGTKAHEMEFPHMVIV